MSRKTSSSERLYRVMHAIRHLELAASIFNLSVPRRAVCHQLIYAGLKANEY